MPLIFHPHRARCVAAQFAATSLFTARFISWCVAVAVVAAAWSTVF